jgi:hypothetical protein
LVIQPEKIEHPGSTGRLADPRERLLLRDRIDRAGFSGVRTSRKRDFETYVLRCISHVWGARQIAGLLIIGIHGFGNAVDFYELPVFDWRSDNEPQG